MTDKLSNHTYLSFCPIILRNLILYVSIFLKAKNERFAVLIMDEIKEDMCSH
jgi:hypothetical protein